MLTLTGASQTSERLSWGLLDRSSKLCRTIQHIAGQKHVAAQCFSGGRPRASWRAYMLQKRRVFETLTGAQPCTLLGEPGCVEWVGADLDDVVHHQAAQAVAQRHIKECVQPSDIVATGGSSQARRTALHCAGTAVTEAHSPDQLGCKRLTVCK